MILEDATYEAFGYEVWELLPQSNKPIIAACEKCGKVRALEKSHYCALCHSCAMKGKHHTEETKARMSVAQKGEKHPMYGKHLTEGHKAKIGAAEKGNAKALGSKRTKEVKALMSAANKGDKNSNWQGGISFEPYCAKFNNAFKEYIRSKFGYKCFLCPTTQEQNGRKLSVHHVNYNKNCSGDGDETCNFVPLCISCHVKTNHNRDYWQKLITDKLHSMIIGWDV